MKIVVLDGYSANPGDLSWDGLRTFGELTVYDRTKACDVIERAKDADLILANKVVLKSDVISALPKLKYIGVLATGYNMVDVEYARSRGIVVTNIPAYSTMSVVQMVFAHIFNITNRVGHYACQSRQGRWSASDDFMYMDTPLHEIAGKTIGVVGLGNIGSKVAAIAHEFGMDVFAYTSKNASGLPPTVHKATFDGLLAVSDILTLHCPLTENTRHIINSDSLAKMKPGAILINTGRGPLVDEHAVADALTSGHLGAYGTDVMSVEPPRADNPLFSAPNAYVTPHIAWATSEARERLVGIAISNVKAFVENNPVNVVS